MTDEIERRDGEIRWWLSPQERIVWTIVPGETEATACRLEQRFARETKWRRLSLATIPPAPRWPL